MKKILTILLLSTSIILLLAVRVIGLDISPQSIGYDEASLGYNAYSILLTGKDEYGMRLPLSLRSYNDFKPALYAYLEIPFIKVFGLNQSSVRLPSAVLGTISLIFLFLILKRVTNKSIPALIGVLILISFLPWRLHFSRVAFEANISMAFFTGIVWCLMNFNKNFIYKLGTIAFSTLAIYSYHSARIAVPAFLFLTIIDPFSFKPKVFLKNPIAFTKRLWPLLLVLLLYLPLFFEFKASLILTRFGQTNVFNHFYPFTPQELILTKNIWLNPLANPIYYILGMLTGHIASYLSPQNLALLIYPGVIKSAQAIGSTGMIGFVGGILFIVGLVTNFREIVLNKEKRIVAYWILAGIVPAAVTWEWFYPLRSLNIYPAIDLIIGLGLITICDHLTKYKNKALAFLWAIVLITIVVATSFYNLISEYNYGAWETRGEFQPGGFKESANLLNTLKDKYPVIYINSSQAQSYEIFWFYLKYPPANIQNLSNRRNTPGIEGPPTIDFDNFVYKKLDWPNDKYKNNFVFWTDSEVKEKEINETKGAKLYKIFGPTGNWTASVITKD